MHLHYGDVCLVDFEPSVGHEIQKRRPAIVIQSERQLRRSNLVTVMPLTSRAENAHRDDIAVRKNSQNRLFADSIVKVHAIASFDKSRFLKQIGRTDVDVLNQIKEYLKNHFDL